MQEIASGYCVFLVCLCVIPPSNYRFICCLPYVEYRLQGKEINLRVGLLHSGQSAVHLAL